MLLPLAIVPCHLPHFIGTLTTKNGCILLLTTVPFRVWLPFSIYSYHNKYFIYSFPFHFTSHFMLPLAMVPCLPYFSGTPLTIENVWIILPTTHVLHYYSFPYTHTSGNILFSLCTSFYIPHIMLPIYIVACHLAYFIGTLIIKNGWILLLIAVPCRTFLLLSRFTYH